MALLAFLVLAVVGPSTELCVGDDGHFAIEPIHQSCPSGATATPSSGPHSVATATQVEKHTAVDVAPCSDVSLGIQLLPPVSRHTLPRLPAPAPAIALPTAPVFVPVVVFARERLRAARPARPPMLTALRTVVLLV